jgi:tripartite-type tricarboxylate transporter receptor subunit TctC
VLAASQALVLMTFIKKENNFDMNLIAYKGDRPLLQDALAGVTDLSISSLTANSPHFRAGKLRPIAPAGTRKPIIDRMNAEVAKAMRFREVSDKFVDQFNMEILTISPGEFADFQKLEQERWTKIIKDNDIRAE